MLSVNDKNIEFAIKTASEYVSDMKHIETCFVKFTSVRETFLWSYHYFVRDGLTPIENLDEETKREIFNTTLEWEPSVLPADVRIGLCRCVWTLNYILDKYLRV